jgi:hypothetical protein
MTTRLLDPEEFMAHRETLNHPDDGTVRDAFARLPKRGCIEVRCRWERRMELQRILTDMGAFAIRLRPLADFLEVQITALKGKVGACFETGRSATYAGAALAVMDDDHHLIVGTIRVCEKTGGLYTLPPYHRLLTVTEGDAGLLERLETDPIPFDCNTFEPDAERLAAQAFVPGTSSELTTPVYYPGPFSLMVLRDGAILRRGQCTQIATNIVKDLQDRDGLLVVPPLRAQEADRPINYPTAFKSLGAGCLLSAAVTATASPVAVLDRPSEASLSKQALDALRNTSDGLRQRLLRLIEGGEPYFILTGSDPKDPLGCCPNTQVGDANRLVDVGLLASYRENAAADSCTTTIYAIAGEITVRDNHPEFTVNATSRREAAAVLTRADGRLRVRRTALKGVLLLLAGASLVIAGRTALAPFLPARSGFDTALVKALNVTTDTPRLFVCLFHGRETCTACETMGRLCRQTIQTDFAPLTRSGRVVFREIAYDEPANRAIKDRLGLFSSTVGLVRYDHGKPQAIRMLTQAAWSLWTDDAAFVRMLRENIQSMLPENS